MSKQPQRVQNMQSEFSDAYAGALATLEFRGLST
jgi:hypothetical protein